MWVRQIAKPSEGIKSKRSPKEVPMVKSRLEYNEKFIKKKENAKR